LQYVTDEIDKKKNPREGGSENMELLPLLKKTESTLC
jgi:hypothetical protein